jgi:hypothetical protein
MTRVPIEPYWFNAIEWWMTTHGYEEGVKRIDLFNEWLRQQGATVMNRTEFYPWVEFELEEYAVLFVLTWG